jgi:hypothetical protein
MNVRQLANHKKTIAAIYVVFILFPNPGLIPLNTYRFLEMPTRPTDDVRLVADSLPENATAIEQYVDDHIYYAYDFQTYGVVWYIPTPSDVLKAQQGDCKSKAVLLASLLEAKQIPHTVKVSPVHFWVDYNGRLRTNFTEQYETTQVAFAENGQFKLPRDTNALLYLNAYEDVVWTSMPLFRKIALIGGLVLIAQFGHFKGSKKRWRVYMGGLLHINTLFSSLR